MLPEGASDGQRRGADRRVGVGGSSGIRQDVRVEDDYELIDAGDGARLERFGRFVVDRPHAGALAPRRAPERWTEADLRFDRDRGWSGAGLAAARKDWPIRIGDVVLALRPTESGQVGCFPEHVQHLRFLAGAVTERRSAGSDVEVLNLFAYTGLATLVLAGCGATVTHVDAARPSVAWARELAAANGLAERPIRWIVEDARAYVRREVRRGRRYDGIVLDPPSYGHAGTAAAWQLVPDLPVLLDGCASLLHDDGFLLLTAHTEGVGPARLGALVRDALGPAPHGRVATGDVELTATSGATLELGAHALVDGLA
jgi:23S rRNA (cytosine1962-C5)-methyltransferase